MLLLNLSETKTKVFAISEKLFWDQPEIFNRWKEVSKVTTPTEIESGIINDNSQSFSALYYLLTTILKQENVKDLNTVIDKYGKQIKELISPLIINELEGNVENKQEIIQQLLKFEVAETGSSLLYHKLREAISLNQFIEKEGVPTVQIKNGSITHVAEIHTHNEDSIILTNAEVEQWETLMTRAITSMDDLTADTFDVISILWMKSANSENDMISFSHEDVLNMRQIQKKKNAAGYESFRKKDRDEVMKRLAALASIWIRVDEDDEVQFIEKRNSLDKDYKKANLKRLFQVDNVTVASDRSTDEMMGILECDIRPGELLSSYLFGAKRSTGFLSLKALQYNPIKHKYHKRLTRYLSWQWRIRQRKADFERPYKIGGNKGGLLSVMGMNIILERPMRTRDSFENVLDTLQADGVIDTWYYTEIDEDKIGKGNKGWLENYWATLTVVIIPPEEILRLENTNTQQRQPLNIDMKLVTDMVKKSNEQIEEQSNKVAEAEPVQLSLDLLYNSDDKEKEKETPFSPELVKELRLKRGLSVSRAAKEIGIAHTTLSRYENGLIQKPNSKNDHKIKIWINRK